MLVSYNWLNEYFDGKLSSPEDVVEMLTTHAFEIEGLEKKNSDYVIDIDVLPNRGADSLCHNGIAKELGVILDMTLSVPIATAEIVENSEELSIEADVPEGLVRRVSKMLMTGLLVGESPDWLKEKLSVLGQQSINNVVDVTNYVMFETGQPIHAFDYDKFAGAEKKMILRMARDGEQLKLLDEKELILDSETIVWADTEVALDIAGIKGGASTGVDENTKRIVLSACNFDPVHIRKTRQRTKVITDASKRFEQNVTAEITVLGLARVAELLKELAGGVSHGVIDIYNQKEERTSASADLESINSILGVNFSESDVESILDRFKHSGFEWSKDSSVYTMLAPFERRDINLKHDVIEEVGRIYGYNNIKSSVPDTADFSPKVYRTFYGVARLKNLLVREGWSEVYNYVMGEKGEVEIENSLVEGMNYVRSDMNESIRKNLEFNIKHADLLGVGQIKLFEINKVFSKTGEHWALGMGVKNTKGFTGPKEREVIEEITKKISDELESSVAWAVKEVSVSTQDDRNGIGVVAELNLEESIKNIELPDSYEGVVARSKSVKRYTPISQYPFVARDIAIWVPKETKAEELLAVVESDAGKLLVRATLFDEFEKDGKVSYAYRLVFQSYEKTLTDNEVNKIMEKVESAVAKKGWEVR